MGAIADRAIWENVTKGRAGIRWGNVVDEVWKEIGGTLAVHGGVWGGARQK